MKRISVWGIVIGMFFFITTASVANATSQVLTTVEEALKANPLPAGEKIQMIKIAEDNTITFFIVRMVEGAEIKPHFHKTHSESVYVIKGAGQMLVEGKWVDIKTGSIHFNPMTQIHGLKNTGAGELVIIAIFTPAMKVLDRHFVP